MSKSEGTPPPPPKTPISDDVFFTDENEADEYANERRKKRCCTRHNCCNCFRKFITFMVSRVGLLILMIGYVCAGGFIFQELEIENERLAYLKSIENIDNLVDSIYERVQKNSIEIEDKSFGIFLATQIEHFRDFVTNSTLNGTLKSGNAQQWDYFGAVFYAVTLVSTIGYGHITCKTKNGKIFTVLYSAIGVPLMMLFLANIGSSTATMFKFIYMKISSFRRKYKMNKFLKSGFKNFEFDCQMIDDKMLKYLRENSSSGTGLEQRPQEHKEIILSEAQRQIEVKQPLEPIDENTCVFDSTDYAEYAKTKPVSFYIAPQCESFNQITDMLNLGIEEVDDKLLETLREMDEMILRDFKSDNDLSEKRKSVNFKSLEEQQVAEVEKKEQNELKNAKRGLLKSFSFRRQKTQLKEDTKKCSSDSKFETNTLKVALKKDFQAERRFSVSDLPSKSIDQKVNLKRQSSLDKQSNAKSLIFRSSITTNQPKASILKNNANATSIVNHQVHSSINKFEFNKKQLKYIYREYKQQQHENVGVPLYITLFIMPLYLIAGMCIFSAFEGWSKLDAFYFSFVTLTTIGFGDFIPGSSLSMHSSLFRMSISSLYILVGLVLIAMCFNLMKKQFKNKVKQFVRRLGFSSC